MTTYGQFCPVALGAEIFAERWTPLILRELLSGGRRFSDIHRGVPRISRNLLTQRLHALQHSGIIEQIPAQRGHGQEYRLTVGGRELGVVIDALGTWGYRWASKDLRDEHLDPDYLMWTMRKLIRVDTLPDQRVVLLFRFRRYSDRLYWLVLHRPDVDLCVFDPGYEVSLEIEASVESLARVCLGQLAVLQAMRDGTVEVHGAPHYRKALSSWLGVTHFADTAKTSATSR
ncbi:MAG TPA: helix-turn-helix domain-containing protein [Gemmatimonadaceae bacterium]|nr:helix-turn-helix domain-containing protein [Gemmatimonadaceae bacterium]